MSLLNRLRIAVALAAILTSTPFSFAAGAINAEPPAAGPLVPYEHVLTISTTSVSGQAELAALWKDKLEPATWQGHAAFRREQANTRPGGTDYVGWFTNVFDTATFQPYFSEHRRKDGLFVRYEFDGLHVRETKSKLDVNSAPRTPPGTPIETVTREFTLSEPVYDYFGGTFGVVFTGIPLRAGLQGSFPALSFSSDGSPVVTRVKYRVSGPENVRNDDCTPVSAWKIETDADADNPVYVYYVTCQTPRVQRLAYRQDDSTVTCEVPAHAPDTGAAQPKP